MLLSPKKVLQDLNIPPRKLLSRRSLPDEYFSDSPSKLLEAEALMQKFLSYNGSGSVDDGFDPDSDPYSSDQFRMYEFKVRKCTRSRSHDWTDCPFAHPGEKARRRDPRRYHYSGTVCPEYRRSGTCSRGDECEFAHGVFECWLHPARYRTEACKDGKNCKRKVCFFAHSPRELRLLPAHEDGVERENCGSKADRNTHALHCCRRCCALSPTSTLLGSRSHFSPPMSPTRSPPQSPMGITRYSPVSRYLDRVNACRSGDTRGLNSKGVSYEDMMIAELLGSLEGININKKAAGSPSKLGPPPAGLWVDVGYDSASSMGDENLQFSDFSPSTPTPVNNPMTSRNVFNGNVFNTSTIVDDKGNESGFQGPDIGWVNDLLM